MGLAPGRYPSPLRYPGGKGKIANYFKLLFLENDLVGSEYVEPYAGGAGVALALLFEDYADVVHINDINRGVHAFWSAALERTDELCERIANTPVTMDEWHRQREVQADPDGAEPLDLAYSTFFLNRVNRSGIIGGGIIGGHAQEGPWKLDARYNRSDLIDRIRKIGRFRSRIVLTRLDAGDMLAQWQGASQRAFIYLDPPYYVKGEGLYDNFYGPEDHQAIAHAVEALPHPWVISYDAAPEISTLYASHPGISYSLSYSAQARYRGSEVMYFSPGLRVPGNLPTEVTSADLAERLA